MTLLRTIIRASDNFFNTKTCFVLTKNNANVENYFASRVEVPSPPKRPLTAYMIFCQENRKIILKDNPSLSTTEQIKLLAKKWTLLTEDMKKPYQLSAREKTQLYGEEHKKFYESLTEEQKEELARLKAKKRESRQATKNKKVLRESGMPKAPNSAYTLFVQSEAKKTHSLKQPSDLEPETFWYDMAPASPNMRGSTDFIKKTAELWRTLPEDSKKFFVKQADDDKKRYLREMKEWQTKVESDKKLLKAYEEVKGRGLRLESESPKKAPKSGSSKN